MNYWHSVLDEVTHKYDAAREFLYTNQGSLAEYCFEQERVQPILNRARQPLHSRFYFLGERYPDIHLTYREAETLFWIVQDFTLRYAAHQMGLSIRTVEFYVKNLRLKLHCRTKKELVEKILQTDLLQQLEVDGMKIPRQ